jgi:beta-galactosidase
MNHVGSYQTTFNVPSTWIDEKRVVILEFQGVSAAFYCFVNGQMVGYSQDSRLHAEFDVTAYLRPNGPNTLSARVYRFCDGSYLEDQDQW